MRILKMAEKRQSSLVNIRRNENKAVHGRVAVVRCPLLRAEQQKVSIVEDYQWQIQTFR